MIKYCSKCDRSLDNDCFHKDKTQKDGLQSYCKSCKIMMTTNWIRKNKKKRKDYQHNYFKKTRIERNRKQLLWRKTPKGKICYSRNICKRKRNLNWIPLFYNPFPVEVDMEYHHINNFFVVPLPKQYHKMTLGDKHKSKCEELIFSLYGLDIQKIFNM